MTASSNSNKTAQGKTGGRKGTLPAAAVRALAEAQARRAAGEGNSPKAGETGGPEGPEPTRFGDWERRGIASDF